VGGRRYVHGDGWEHRALGSRNVRQKDIKDIRYGTPLCFTLLPTCPVILTAALPGPHIPESSRVKKQQEQACYP
ncbi:mRNA 3'-end-processing protein RNA14, partial [Dissostichus eleginoides]